MTIADTFPNGLRPLQVQGSIRGWQQRSLIFADQPGAGKTAQVEVAVELDGQWAEPQARILITAPKTACQLMWARELHERVASQFDVVIADLTGSLDSKRGRKQSSMVMRNDYLGQKMIEAHDRNLPLIVLTNFEGLRWPATGKPALYNLWKNRYSTIIVDESHLVLPRREDDERKMTATWRGIRRLVTTENCLRFPMSGTPDNGKLENRFGTYAFMYPQRFSSYWGWVRYFFHVKQNNWGGADILGLKADRRAEWDAFQNQVMVRRTKAEMLQGLPPKQIIHVPLKLSDEHREKYDKLEKALEAKLKEATPEQYHLALAHTKHELRKLSVVPNWSPDAAGKPVAYGESVVLDWIAEFLTERGHHEETPDPTGGKVVISGFIIPVLRWLQQELGKLGFGQIPMLTGETPLEEKQTIEAAFQRGELRCILFSGHIGVSISLDAADDMIFPDLVKDPDKVEQTEDRIHRASSTGVKQFWRLVPEDTMAEEIAKANDVRFAATRRSYDGSRGVDFRRQIVKLKSEGDAA